MGVLFSDLEDRDVQGASSAWQAWLGVWLGWSPRQPESGSNTNKILPQLALKFHEIRALGWRYAPTEIGAVYCAHKPEVHCS